MEKMKLLAQWTYTPKPIHRGYTKEVCLVDLGNRDGKYRFETKTLSDEFVERFTGGRGFGLGLLWEAVNENTKWDDPENEIIISGGPLCGITQYPGAGKCYSVFLSPATKQTYASNAGGYFGPLIKFSGFDSFELRGIADRNVIIFVDGDQGKVEIYESPFSPKDNSYTITDELHDYFSAEDEDRENGKRAISVVSTGQAAAHSYICGMNFSFYDLRRKVARLKQAGRGGGGTVLRHKGVHALVVKKRKVTGVENDPADLATLQQVGIKLHKEIHDYDDVQCKMRKVGTAHLNEVMNDYHLLPVNNYKFGQHPDINNIHSDVYTSLFTQGLPDGCWYGCSLSCAKAADNFELKTGPWKGKKVTVDGPEYETAASLGSVIGIFDPKWTIEANFYADHYGFDTISLGTILAFLAECYELGLINKDHTGGLELTFGNKDAMMEMIHRMAEGTDEFAVAASRGIRYLKDFLSEKYGADRKVMEDIGMEGQGLEVSQYRCQESIAQWGGYFLTLKGPQHDEAWLIFMDMVNKQLPTFEDKAEALYYFPNFRLWFSLVGLCKLPWNDIEPADNHIRYKGIEAAKVPEHVQNYVDIFNAVTGKNITKEDIITQSEKVYNFERVFNLRMGKGTREWHNIPARGLGPVFEDEYMARPDYFDDKLREAGIDPQGLSVKEKIEKLQAHRRAQWEKLVDAVYKRRGWNKNGIPTLETVKRLGIDTPEVVEVLKKHLRPEDEWDN
ncbi:aldehyde ferredoxin oxidoreductase family protein [Thermanaerovibrio acidaminovorans]|jgi:aldehyde:ferredoxin oxidoreductase|uniref:Aldehyde ferredoxin oxidoreductase n=1 Tax=Thermanaerovibrio acidaminovorans (strain ATCC 49978 / DSM 6589 / Su883) TaxID=525903 RepID=D1B9T3_THEAS|nr:aldehyde ferredoxin oxidoreductase C-terminal domain-containing protein [Thermanaerovibrio acidaminovorans]ACZ19036.1 Aldehyde ferredoxin oxidoreductase [Thermanaerovibrio acidaminovorans DSM 6589]